MAQAQSEAATKLKVALEEQEVQFEQRLSQHTAAMEAQFEAQRARAVKAAVEEAVETERQAGAEEKVSGLCCSVRNSQDCASQVQPPRWH